MMTNVPSGPNREADIFNFNSLDSGWIEKKLKEQYNWSNKRIAQVRQDYIRFLLLHKWFKGEVLVPSPDIDRFWHSHIIHTKRYREDCERLFGYFLDHTPNTGNEGQEKLERIFQRTRELFLQEFKVDPFLTKKKATDSSNSVAGCNGAGATCHNGQYSTTELYRLRFGDCG